jgi:hypothetical protein
MLRSEQTINAATRKGRVTSEQFYVDMAYKYQEGDNLVVVNPATQELGYEVIDETKQIIKQANIGVSSLGIFFLNIATADNNNNILALTPAQVDAFREYYQNFIAMGAQCTITSQTPAIFSAEHLYIRFYRTYNLESIKEKLTKAFHDLQIQKRSNNKLYVNEVESYLSSIDGVRDAYFFEPSISFNDEVLKPEDGVFILQPGYFNFDPTLYDYGGSSPITTFESV